jgi:hypothetical protein
MQVPRLGHDNRASTVVPDGTTEVGKGMVVARRSGPELTTIEDPLFRDTTPAHHVGVAHVAKLPPLVRPTIRPVIVPSLAMVTR